MLIVEKLGSIPRKDSVFFCNSYSKWRSLRWPHSYRRHSKSFEEGLILTFCRSCRIPWNVRPLGNVILGKVKFNPISMTPPRYTKFKENQKRTKKGKQNVLWYENKANRLKDYGELIDQVPWVTILKCIKINSEHFPLALN